MTEPAISLYTAGTPNGHKASIMLEELGIAYHLHAIDLGSGAQKKPEFLSINPNGRIPAIVDHEAGDFAVFESGALMIYLAEKYGQLMPKDVKGRSEVIQWLMFQMGGVGPMQGQANVFFRYWHEKYQPAIDRYQKETKRLYGVLDARLACREYLCAEYSIADIANFTWVNVYAWAGLEIDDLPNLSAWHQRILARPAVQRGLKVPGERAAGDQIVKSAQSMLVR